MRLSYLYEDRKKRKHPDNERHGFLNNPKQNPKGSGDSESESEGCAADTVKKRPSFGASSGVYRGPRSA
jgi:hypothetical protein